MLDAAFPRKVRTKVWSQCKRQTNAPIMLTSVCRALVFPLSQASRSRKWEGGTRWCTAGSSKNPGRVESEAGVDADGRVDSQEYSGQGGEVRGLIRGFESEGESSSWGFRNETGSAIAGDAQSGMIGIDDVRDVWTDVGVSSGLWYVQLLMMYDAFMIQKVEAAYTYYVPDLNLCFRIGEAVKYRGVVARPRHYKCLPHVVKLLLVGSVFTFRFGHRGTQECRPPNSTILGNEVLPAQRSELDTRSVDLLLGRVVFLFGCVLRETSSRSPDRSLMRRQVLCERRNVRVRNRLSFAGFVWIRVGTRNNLIRDLCRCLDQDDAKTELFRHRLEQE
ncbi:hypothetical protein FPV67DRAFT_1448777 [Lyophyllum atratum]|nr:hypothetical protein FPV67DRAFT_1448777 [Lyophyllum atratum]